MINRVAQIAAFFAIFAGYAIGLAQFHSSVIASLGIFALAVLFVLLVIVRDVRRHRRRGGSDAGHTRRLIFGVITRTHHAVDTMSTEDTAAALAGIFGDRRPFARLLESGLRCRDCGHEEFLLRSDGGESFALVLYRDSPPVHMTQWIVGLFGGLLTTKEIPVHESVEAGDDGGAKTEAGNG
jgi:hypothetical protein